MRAIALLAVMAVFGALVSSAAGRLVEHEPHHASPPASPWKLPVAFTAWGFEEGTLSATELADRLVAADIRSIAIQIGQDGPRAARSDAEVFDRAGLDVYLWGITDAGDHRAALDAFAGIVDGYIVQVEDDEQYHALLANVAGGVGDDLPRGVVTTFEGVNTTRNGLVQTPERMQPLVAAGITTAFVECYRGDDPRHADLPLMIWQAHRYGWTRAVPVVGLFRGDRLSNYEDLDDRAGAWGFWNAEQIHPDDWPILTSRRLAGS